MTSNYPDLMAMHLFEENEVNLMKTERELQMTHLSETEELARARRSKFQDESRLVAWRQALPCTDIIIQPPLWRGLPCELYHSREPMITVLQQRYRPVYVRGVGGARVHNTATQHLPRADRECPCSDASCQAADTGACAGDIPVIARSLFRFTDEQLRNRLANR